MPLLNRRTASPVAIGGAKDTTQGDAGGVGSYLQLAPWQEPPIGSTPLFISAKAATVGANDRQTPAALQMQIPSNRQAVIKGLTLFIENPVSTTNVLWSLLINGAPVPGATNLTILGRAASSITRPLSLLVFVPPNATTGVTMLNVDGGAYSVGADVEGWTYPLATR